MMGLLFALALVSQPGGTRNEPGPDVRCGGFCLFVALGAFDKAPAGYKQLETILGTPTVQGYSLRRLETAAAQLGANTIAVETSIENLRHRRRSEKFSCLTILGEGHFVLIDVGDPFRVKVIDPPRSYQMATDVFRSAWRGKSLLISDQSLRSEESVKWSRLAWDARYFLGAAVVVPIALAVARLVVVRSRRSPRSTIEAGRRIALLLCVLPIPSVIAGCGSSPRGEPARSDPGRWLWISEERKDLGTLFQSGGAREVDFSVGLENRGPEAIKILGVETSCACTRATLTSSTIEPRGRILLEASVRIGDTAESNSAKIFLRCDDALEPRREIQVTWVVKTLLGTSLTSLQFPQTAPGASSEQTIPLDLEGMRLCRDCEIRCRPTSQAMQCSANLDGSLVRVGNHSPADGTVGRSEIGRLKITQSAQSAEQHYSGAAEVFITCHDRNLTSFKLPVSWTVSHPLQVSPDRFYVGDIRPGARVGRTMVVQSRDGIPFKILDVKADGFEIRGAGLPSDAADILHQFPIEFDAPKQAGPWRAVVRLETDHPDKASREVAVSGIVRVPGDGP